MIESKLDITKRLRDEGRWDEAEQYKNAEIKRLRADGLHRPEAQAQAWAAMAEKFPPLPIETPESDDPNPEFTPELISSLPESRLKDFAADAEWVYTNLEEKRVDGATAPSKGAIPLLKWARLHKGEFYNKLMPRAITSQENKPDVEEDKQVAGEPGPPAEPAGAAGGVGVSTRRLGVSRARPLWPPRILCGRTRERIPRWQAVAKRR